MWNHLTKSSLHPVQKQFSKVISFMTEKIRYSPYVNIKFYKSILRRNFSNNYKKKIRIIITKVTGNCMRGGWKMRWETLKVLFECLHNDFETIMHALTEEVKIPILKTHLDEYMGSSDYRLYIYSRQIRWHPSIIKWYVRVYIWNSVPMWCTEVNLVLTPPPERTLRDYTHWMKGHVGFSSSLNRELIIKKKMWMKSTWCLSWMILRCKWILYKQTLARFVNLGEINRTHDKFKRQCQSE